MMATELNINDLIERMELIIQYNGDLFDREKKGLKKATLLKKIIKGVPKELPTEYPCLMLIPGKPLREKQYMGTDAYYNRIRVVARLLVSSDDHEKMQEQMIDIEALLLETFEENRKLTNPKDSADTTGLIKHIIGERTVPLDGLFIRSTGAIVDGLEITFVLEQSNN